MSRDSRAGRDHRYKYYLRYVFNTRIHSMSRGHSTSLSGVIPTTPQALQVVCTAAHVCKQSCKKKKRRDQPELNFPVSINYIVLAVPSRTFKKCLESFLSLTHTLPLWSTTEQKRLNWGGEAKERKVEKKGNSLLQMQTNRKKK